MTHTIKTLTEAELKQEIARINDGAVSSFEQPLFAPGAEIKMNGIKVVIGSGTPATIGAPKKRGRPKGSKNKVK